MDVDKNEIEPLQSRIVRERLTQRHGDAEEHREHFKLICVNLWKSVVNITPRKITMESKRNGAARRAGEQERERKGEEENRRTGEKRSHSAPRTRNF